MSRENELFSLDHVPGCAFRKSRRASASAMKGAGTGKNGVEKMCVPLLSTFLSIFLSTFSVLRVPLLFACASSEPKTA